MDNQQKEFKIFMLFWCTHENVFSSRQNKDAIFTIFGMSGSKHILWKLIPLLNFILYSNCP